MGNIYLCIFSCLTKQYALKYTHPVKNKFRLRIWVWSSLATLWVANDTNPQTRKAKIDEITRMQRVIRAASSEFVSSSIPSWQILNAHVQPFRGARDLAFCLKVPLDSLLVWASSGGSDETARMRRLAWTVAARISDKYQIRLTRPIRVFTVLTSFCRFCSFPAYLYLSLSSSWDWSSVRWLPNRTRVCHLSLRIICVSEASSAQRIQYFSVLFIRETSLLRPLLECLYVVPHLSRSTTKPTKWSVRPAKTQISLGIRPVWSAWASAQSEQSFRCALSG